MVAGGSVFDVKVTRPSAWSSNRAPKIGLSVQALAARKTPGPGSYRHERSLVESTSGGRLSTLEPPSMIASMMGERIHYPGPGNYEVGAKTRTALPNSHGSPELARLCRCAVGAGARARRVPSTEAPQTTGSSLRARPAAAVRVYFRGTLCVERALTLP